MFKKKTKNNQLLNLRLTQLMREQSMTISILSEKSGVAVGTIQKMMRDDHCNPTIFSLEAICRALGTSIGQLLEGHDLIDTSKNTIPLFAWEELVAALDDFNTMRNRAIATGHIIHAAEFTSEDAFSLTMIGNSMWPAFPEGAILVFDKSKKPYDGSYALVLFEQEAKIAFKQILLDEPYTYAKSVHPTLDNNLIKLTTKDKIVAVLVQSKMNYCRGL